jgi:AraC-like DNA-binding protein
MRATMTERGMVLASDGAEAKNDKKSRPANDARAGREYANFFVANGISPPSSLFEEMSDTFYFAKNKEGKFVWGNRLLQEKHRLARAEDIIGKCDHDFFRRDIADRIRADDLAVMESGVPVKDKLEVICGSNGVLTWLFTTKAPLRNAHGEVIGVEGFSRDAQRSQDVIAPFHVFRDAIEYLQVRFKEKISIEHLASLSGMSLSTFERRFKQHFSLTPKQYILHMRVHEACRLLPGSKSIERVALETGFGGQSYFTVQFRSVVGITPKQYQRSVAAARREAAGGAG